ncbi:MAG: hypothetical protein ACJAYU_000879 [Bradymonadia bacterium]|jgi:uncharacterized protein YhhL (DUF1145 family)
MIAAKIAIVPLWIWAISSIVAPEATPFANVGFWLGAVTLGAHVVECVVMKKTFERAGGSLGSHIAQTLVFGFGHWLPLWKAQKG